jgi:two-component system, OmpR family, response regulator
MNSKGQAKIFIVEDNFMYSYVLDHALKEYGNFVITTFDSGEECIQLLGNSPDLVILDYNLGKGMNGMEVMKAILAKKPKTKVVVISGQNDVQLTADLMKEGAYDYVEKRDTKATIERLLQSITGVVYK